jgi:hypothetical protein
MSSQQPSRRQLLGALLGLFCWRRPSKAASPTPPAKAAPVAWFVEPPLGRCCTLTFDAQGRLTRVTDPAPYWQQEAVDPACASCGYSPFDSQAHQPGAVGADGAAAGPLGDGGWRPVDSLAGMLEHDGHVDGGAKDGTSNVFVATTPSADWAAAGLVWQTASGGVAWPAP